MIAGLLYGHDKEVAEWVAAGVEGVQFHEPYSAIGYVSNGRLVNGAVFNSWNFSNIDLSIRSDGFARRAFIAACHSYCFQTLEANRITIRTRRSNHAARAGALRLGFVYEATLRRYYGPHKADDAIQFRLMRDEKFRFTDGLTSTA